MNKSLALALPAVLPVLVLAVIVAWSNVTRPPNVIVDGWLVGPETNCDVGSARCGRMVEVARDRLDKRDTGHPPIADESLHTPLTFFGNGEAGLAVTSGGFRAIVLFDLADGSRAAIYVGYTGIAQEPTADDYGPYLDR